MVIDRQMIILFSGGIIVAVVSLIDDWKELSARIKLFIQICVVLAMVYFGIVLDLFPQTIWGYWLNVLFTILWIIGITNSMNFIDGMDGLAAGIGAIIAIFMGVVAFQTDQPLYGMDCHSHDGKLSWFSPF
jgi:UDP-GlcNAc:undecaprenyl-phosphate GlcNAc-1-phosphate transferase